ncbi:hypothetical protein GDO81_011100 [Engystomops pustulosus]|uniref:Uncharacterized protein n=1 Tax=Engystomops pustulosus TaxID=76066 RepID=A0AAV7C5Z8_ENGPU|nr:hypothetical protein GDO81_011100 [Engystomops pustulosus]
MLSGSSPSRPVSHNLDGSVAAPVLCTWGRYQRTERESYKPRDPEPVPWAYPSDYNSQHAPLLCTLWVVGTHFWIYRRPGGWFWYCFCFLYVVELLLLTFSLLCEFYDIV